MDEATTSAILRTIAEALEAADGCHGEGWYEPADLQLTLRFGGLADTPHVAGWEATLGELTISGANTPLIALEMLRDACANLRRFGGER